MKRIVAALFLLAAFALSCAHVTPVVKDCGEQAVLSIIDDVNTALATDDWRAGLAALVEKFGMCAVEGAVKIVAGADETKAQFDSLAALMVQRAKQWLSEQPPN